MAPCSKKHKKVQLTQKRKYLHLIPGRGYHKDTEPLPESLGFGQQNDLQLCTLAYRNHRVVLSAVELYKYVPEHSSEKVLYRH